MTFPNFRPGLCVRRTMATGAILLAICVFGADAPPVPAIESAAPAVSAKPAPEPADNSFCYVCHRNFEKEPLTVKHAKIGVGCELCHGMSERHSADEDGVTPPEKMYSKARINPSCVQCHTVEKLKDTEAHRLALSLAKDGKPGETTPPAVQAGAAPVKRICTDCHGQHRMKVRTRVWDKDTGKLIKDDGVRMMDKSRPAK